MQDHCIYTNWQHQDAIDGLLSTVFIHSLLGSQYLERLLAHFCDHIYDNSTTTMHTTTTAAWVVHNELPRISFGCTNGRSIVRKERYEKNNYFLYLYHHILYAQIVLNFWVVTQPVCAPLSPDDKSSSNTIRKNKAPIKPSSSNANRLEN